MNRRDWLKACSALAAANLPVCAALAAGRADTLRRLGKPEPFDYAQLKGRARVLASQPYKPTANHLPEAVKNLDYDEYQSIRYRPDHALWAAEHLPFEARFFHLGMFFTAPVRMYEVIGGQAQELAYDPAMFDYGKSGLAASRLPKDLGFAGFNLFTYLDPKRDVAAFLGASYFRAVGAEMQYGMSARGLSIDTGMSRAEEFPSFVAFWLERPARNTTRVAVYALLDSPSVAGAYRFEIFPEATLVMDVDAALYPRKEIERLGIAPRTSMYLHGENDHRAHNDWRPEIHDSDGLSMWTGAGEWIWRPLVNPATRRFNAYQDNNPRGFGLLQRDRNFDHYQDDGVFYERRPSVWVEPKSGWGKGSVQLVELSTPDETFDNIVAFWNPAEKPRPGQELLFGYRLHWGSRMPFASSLAQVVSTYTGIGGVVGQPRKYFSWRFVIDFSGGPLAMVGKDATVEPVISTSRGEVEITSARPLNPISPLLPVSGYRAMFDLKSIGDSLDPIDLRLYLRLGGQPLSETWIYQWTPPPLDQRKV